MLPGLRGCASSLGAAPIKPAYSRAVWCPTTPELLFSSADPSEPVAGALVSMTEWVSRRASALEIPYSIEAA